MARAVEYLDEAIEEAEAAARWYAERSASAADAFADEIDAAVTAIGENPRRVPTIRVWRATTVALRGTVIGIA